MVFKAISQDAPLSYETIRNTIYDGDDQVQTPLILTQ